MASQCTLRGFLSLTMLAAVAACSSLPAGPHDLLDEHTGATVSVVGAPITFVRQPNGQPSKDFLTLVAIQKDDAGKYTQLLLLYRWSAYFAPVSSSPADRGDELLIDIDGHSIELQPLHGLTADLPRPKDLFVPATTEATMRAYVTDLETMRLIATSHELTLRLPQVSQSDPFLLWQDSRPALAQFVKQLSGS
jgi:hypothetical protein